MGSGIYIHELNEASDDEIADRMSKRCIRSRELLGMVKWRKIPEKTLISIQFSGSYNIPIEMYFICDDDINLFITNYFVHHIHYTVDLTIFLPTFLYMLLIWFSDIIIYN